MSAMKVAALLGSLAATVVAHGTVSNIRVGNNDYQGYSPSMQYTNPPPKVAGWSVPEDLSNGFIDPNNYTTQNIICHLDATPGQSSVPVAAGDNVTFMWTPWPSSHHGPVLTYLANCNGNCETVDKTKLLFNKVDAVGLTAPGEPGTWATDGLIANNNSWTFQVPSSIAPGNYVARHEIIALHSAGTADGAQNYPQCVNFQVTGTGTDALASGTAGEALYKPSDAGISINIYTSMTSYPMPGPTLYSGAAAGGAQPTAPASSAASSAAAAPTGGASSAAGGASSAPAATSAAAGASSQAAGGAASSVTSAASPPSSTGKSCKRKAKRHAFKA